MAKLHTLVDNFNDNSLNASLWSAAGTVTETGGRAVITPRSGHAFLTSATTYDLTASQIVAELPVVTATGTTGTLQSGLVIQDVGGNSVGIFKSGANIICQKVVGGVATNVYTNTYSSTNHRYWRLREASNIFYWEVSSAGVSWTPLFSTTVSTNLFPLSVIAVSFYAGWTSGTEVSPGTFAIETVNPTYLQNLAGLYALSYSGQSVTNAPATTHTIASTGLMTTGGSLAATIGAVSAGAGIRDLAGNLAAGYAAQPVTNALSPPLTITSTGLLTTGGFLQARRNLYITASGTSGREVLYEGDVGYDETVTYDGNFTQGSLSATVLPVGATELINAFGTFATGGSLSADVVVPGDLTATGLLTTGGSLVLNIPVQSISSAGAITLSGSLRLLTQHLISATGQTWTGGSAELIVLTRTFVFEPPVVYDLPPTLPDPRPRYINAHARWKKGQRRGRTVLKNSGVYTIVDTPTVDQINSADIAYQGGHIYTIDQDEAFALITAGFTVTGFEVSPAPAPTSGFPSETLFPADSLFPAT